MSTEGTYYVPEQSKLPIFAATGMGVMAYGAASWVLEGGSSTIFLIGSLIMAAVLYKWWSIVIDENMRGLARRYRIQRTRASTSQGKEVHQ